MSDRSDEISNLQRQLDTLRDRVSAVRRRSDGIPPLETWVKGAGERVSDLLRAPDDDQEVENLRSTIAELEAYLAEYE